MLNPQEIAGIVSEKKMGTQAQKGLRNPQEVKLKGSEVSRAVEASKKDSLKKAKGDAGLSDSVSGSSAPGDYSQYGLKLSDATKSNTEEGIVGDGLGNFYEIEGFERQQRDDLDTDQGDVFSSSLEKDSGIDVTTFNTASDVEAALQELAGGVKPEEGPVETHTQLSKPAAESKALVEAYDDHVMSGDRTEMIFGKNPVDGTTERSGLDDFVFNYKQKVKDLLVPTPVPGSPKKDKQGQGFQ